MGTKGRSIMALFSTLWMPFGIAAGVCFLSAAGAFWHAWKYGVAVRTLYAPQRLSFLGSVRYVNDGDIRRINRFAIIFVVTAILAILSYLPGMIAAKLHRKPLSGRAAGPPSQRR